MIILVHRLYCDHVDCNERYDAGSPNPVDARSLAARLGWEHRLRPVDGFARPVDFCPSHAGQHHHSTIATIPNEPPQGFPPASQGATVVVPSPALDASQQAGGPEPVRSTPSASSPLRFCSTCQHRLDADRCAHCP